MIRAGQTARLSTPSNGKEITATVYTVRFDQETVLGVPGEVAFGHASMELELVTSEAPIGAFSILTIQTDTWSGEGILTAYESHAERRTVMTIQVTKGEM